MGYKKAVHVDESTKTSCLRRLDRIAGQVGGVRKMVEDERYCGDVLTQISAVEEALRGVAAELLRNHMLHCARKAMRGTDRDAVKMADEIVALVRRHGH